uniref:Uncharacterized protein n=1 Tax=Entomoneis paludosa TaxID=265537 RepID=A0A7S2Y7I9_9STRA|mmetsp:Transcript_21150/g.44190  ORF Transcript_21150/g.44190 Transcript_21150/m.44190 type:complete len:937 (+) Transcript_21150:344-3154(+)|eukprot:CAMPEP_0172465876 /NCGR_PEP_ID=MMETSP1065-20121228/54658_1 /TAXON_ID=265537 /ORGANISM="Amphiprora paludosa, Strain CCMP125" /LENGTH=936 /DNA_ID=CAMNT_0013222531 /DNA_START=80 /DNA_END=2890 /DNA_ORIENTATION=+
MKALTRRARSKSPFQRRRKASELIEDVQELEAQQYEQNQRNRQQTYDYEPPPPFPSLDQGRQPYHGNEDETAAIEVVLDATSLLANGGSNKNKSNNNRNSRKEKNDKKKAQQQEKKQQQLQQKQQQNRRISTTRKQPIPAPLVPSDLPDLGTLSTASSADSPHKLSQENGIMSEQSKRQLFKEKYMDPTNPLESRRCLTFLNGPTTPASLLNKEPLRLPPSDTKSYASRSTSYNDHFSTPSTPPRKGGGSKAEPVVVLSPYNSASRRSRSQSRTGRTTGSAAGESSFQSSVPIETNIVSPPPTPAAAAATRASTLSPQLSRTISPQPTEAAVASPGGAPVMPKILRRFQQQQQPEANKNPTTPTSPTPSRFSFKKNKDNTIKEPLLKEEKKEDDNDMVKPPKELIISTKKSSPIDLLRSKSIFSEISATSSFHDGMGGTSVKDRPPNTEVGRMLRTIEGSLEAATSTGKQIDRLLVYKTLLEVSDTLEDDKERAAMQQELSALLDRSQDNPNHVKDLQNRLLRGAPLYSKPVKTVRITTPGETQDDDNVPERETKITIQEIEPAKHAMIGNRADGKGDNDDYEEDDESMQSYDSAVSRDTFNFLNELFSFNGFFGITTPTSPNKPRRSKRYNSHRGRAKQGEQGPGDDDDWTGFMEEHGLPTARQRRKVKPVSLLRTYSEETGFTDDSAFTSRFSRGTGMSQSYYTAGSQSQYTDGMTEASSQAQLQLQQQLQRQQSDSSNRSWWRQKNGKDPAPAEKTSNNSRNSMRQRMKQRQKNEKEPLDGDLDESEMNVPRSSSGKNKQKQHSQPLRSPQDVTQPRESRRSGIISPPSSRRGNSKTRKGNASPNLDDDQLSLSSIESNLYNDKYRVNGTKNNEDQWVTPGKKSTAFVAVAADKEVAPVRSLSRGRSGRSQKSSESRRRSKSFDGRPRTTLLM